MFGDCKMKNNILDIEGQVNTCTSCQLCYAICPTKAISIKLDNEGFYRPIINENVCVSCGKCKEICYKYDTNIKISDVNQGVYAAKSKNKKVLESSTSGGVGTHLAESLLAAGYKIIGVTYNYKNNRAENIILNNFNEIYKIQGSKYIQSYSAEVFRKFIDDLPNSKYAIFGLPCQIYALDKYLNKINRRNEFVLIDLFCHGCPSFILWDKYLKYIKSKKELSDINRIEFRSKKRGWHQYILYISDKNGKTYISKNEHEGFYRLFFSDKILNDSCYNCKLRSTLNYTDIRLGDFWGNKYDFDTEGVSAVVSISFKGKEIFNKIGDNLLVKKESLEDVVSAQSYGKKYIVNREKKNKILKLLVESDDFKKILKNYHKTLSYKERVKYHLKKIYYLLPKNLRNFLRKIYHKLKKGI